MKLEALKIIADNSQPGSGSPGSPRDDLEVKAATRSITQEELGDILDASLPERVRAQFIGVVDQDRTGANQKPGQWTIIWCHGNSTRIK